MAGTMRSDALTLAITRPAVVGAHHACMPFSLLHTLLRQPACARSSRKTPSPSGAPTLSLETPCGLQPCFNCMETETVYEMRVGASSLCQGGHIWVGLVFPASLKLSSCPPSYMSVSQGACGHLSSDTTWLAPTKLQTPLRLHP